MLRKNLQFAGRQHHDRRCVRSYPAEKVTYLQCCNPSSLWLKRQRAIVIGGQYRVRNCWFCYVQVETLNYVSAMADERHSAQEPPVAAVLRLAAGFGIFQAMHVAAKLGIADVLVSGPKSADAIAQEVSADPASLQSNKQSAYSLLPGRLLLFSPVWLRYIRFEDGYS